MAASLSMLLFIDSAISITIENTNILPQANDLINDMGRSRIINFGLSQIMYSSDSTNAASAFGGKGHVRWQAPELLNPVGWRFSNWMWKMVQECWSAESSKRPSITSVLDRIALLQY